MRALALVAILTSGCSLALSYDECNLDQDCARYAADGGAAYCTSDHMCVNELPDERLCALAPGSPQAGSDTLVVAGLFRLGIENSATDGQAYAKALRLAMQDTNMAGQRPVQVVLCDTGTGASDQVVRAITQAATRFHAVAAVGPYASGDVIAAFQSGVLPKYHVLCVSPSATSPAITSLDDNNLIWRTAASDSLQAKVLVPLVPASSTKLDVDYANTPYGTGLAQAFLGAWQMGLKTPDDNFSFMQNSDMTAVVDRLKMHAPDTALLIADTDAPNLVDALGMGGSALAKTQFLMTDAAKGANLLSSNASLDVLKRLRGTAPATPAGPGYTLFKSEYTSAYGSDPSANAFVANAYDAFFAIYFAAATIARGAPLSGESIAKGMTHLSTAGAKAIQLGSFSDITAGYTLLSQGMDVNLQGTSGPIDFDAHGDVVTAPIEVWAVDTTTSPPQFQTLSVTTP